LGAKRRRNKKRSSRLSIFKALNRIKNGSDTRTFKIKNPWIKKHAYAYGYRTLRGYTPKIEKEPEPLIDIFEGKDEIIVVAECVGFKRENLRIRVKNERLTLNAETLDRKYYKSLNLPKRVIPNTLRTTYKNGVLEIRLKKVPEEKAIEKMVD
jgi:HSP20 family molecular chaperone IbpA